MNFTRILILNLFIKYRLIFIGFKHSKSYIELQTKCKCWLRRWNFLNPPDNVETTSYFRLSIVVRAGYSPQTSYKGVVTGISKPIRGDTTRAPYATHRAHVDSSVVTFITCELFSKQLEKYPMSRNPRQGRNTWLWIVVDDCDYHFYIHQTVQGDTEKSSLNYNFLEIVACEIQLFREIKYPQMYLPLKVVGNAAISPPFRKYGKYHYSDFNAIYFWITLYVQSWCGASSILSAFIKFYYILKLHLMQGLILL
jgi:hypothetical protein